jgi:acetoin utilization deacetylase AcuC-like enzyme
MKKRNSQKAITLIITVFLVTICFLEPVHAAEQSNQMPSTNQSLDATDATKPSPRKVGYVFEEKYMWHTPWIVQFSPLVQPFQHWEHAETKRRLHNLLLVSKIYDKLTHLQPIHPASESDIELVHTKEYIQSIQMQSARMEGGFADEETTFSQYAYDIAALAVGGTITAVDSVMQKHVDSAYVLCRPPGHHASSNTGEGFCIFNNIAIAARHLLQKYPNDVKKIAIADYDVHHGNGSQEIFYKDENVLFISVHQEGNFPTGSGQITDIGEGAAKGSTINIPLPPGSGGGAYKYTFEKIALPALKRFQPDFILVSSGLDASYADPLSAMILTSRDFAYMASSLVNASEELCDGRIVFLHEGGYSESYVPFCGAAVIEAMMGLGSEECIEDPFLEEVAKWGGQGLQDHQSRVIDKVAALHTLTDASSCAVE